MAWLTLKEPAAEQQQAERRPAHEPFRHSIGLKTEEGMEREREREREREIEGVWDPYGGRNLCISGLVQPLYPTQKTDIDGGVGRSEATVVRRTGTLHPGLPVKAGWCRQKLGWVKGTEHWQECSRSMGPKERRSRMQLSLESFYINSHQLFLTLSNTL